MPGTIQQFDIERARRETPGCAHVLHFNNAGASLIPQPVFDAVSHYQLTEAHYGGYETARQLHDQVEHVYDAAARLLHCQPDEIAFVENATRAWDLAFYAIPFQPEDRILTARVEYASNYIAFLQVAQRTGARIEVISSDAHGRVSVEALRNMIDERVKLIAITHVPTNGGLVNPAREIGAVAREAGVLFLLDACQSVGQMPVDVQAFNCDMLSTTGRKYLRGPRGTGLLYVRHALLDQLVPPFLDLHAATWVTPNRYEMRSDARRFENWERNYAGQVGLGVAIDYALDWGLESIWERIQLLASQLRTRLSQIPGVTVQDLGVEQCGIVTFTVDKKNLEEIKQKLAEQHINCEVSVRSSTLLDMEMRGLNQLIRASVHYYNTEQEIIRFCDALAQL